MSNLIRWEPAREMLSLREAMDRLFDDAFTQPLAIGHGGRGAGLPAIDLYQTDDEVIVKASLPGFKPDQVQVNVTGDVLTIKGEAREEQERGERAYHVRERRWGSFERSLMLPAGVAADKARADFEDGVLTVSLPKAEEARPKSISIKAR
jgi:HSP20 family protein